jgi:hypothetical protein
VALGRAPSTVSREVRRNRSGDEYHAAQTATPSGYKTIDGVRSFQGFVRPPQERVGGKTWAGPALVFRQSSFDGLGTAAGLSSSAVARLGKPTVAPAHRRLTGH